MAPLTDDIERGPHLDSYRLVLGGVIDDILANELETIVRLVELRDTYSARWQGDPEAVSFFVVKLEIDIDFRVHGQSQVAVGVWAAVKSIPRLQSIVDKQFSRRNLLSFRKELNLFR